MTMPNEVQLTVPALDGRGELALMRALEGAVLHFQQAERATPEQIGRAVDWLQAAYSKKESRHDG